MTESGERIESDCQEPECLRCEHHEEDEYNSWCNAGIPEHVREVFEGDGFDDPCPLRAALKERDEWKAKAEKYRLRVADYECELVRNEGECCCFTIPPKTCVRDGRMCQEVLKAVDGDD